MSNKESSVPVGNPSNVIQLRVASLILLCVSLVAVTALSVGGVALWFAPAGRGGPAYGQPTPLSAGQVDTNPPWGELVKFDLEVEQPDEYVEFEPISNRVARWFFPGRAPAQVRGLLQSLKLPAPEIEQILASNQVAVESDQTVITPAPQVVRALSPEARKSLYTELAQTERNRYMHFPYCFMTNRPTEFFAKSGVAPETIKLIEDLTYERNGAFYFSDVEAVLDSIPTPEQRRLFFKTLSRSSVVMARLRVRPDTDVDKVLGYWAGKNLVRQKDLRPLLESVKRQEGGTLSLLYFLPPFARERLFTSPLPSSPGDPNMDCHWTAMNFFNQAPDYRFSDLTYTSGFVKTNYYPVAQPSSYGDILFLLDREGNAIHSAVYIADDIVFTKNGNNYAQPWVMMRLPNLLALYCVSDTPRVACYRHKSS